MHATRIALALFLASVGANAAAQDGASVERGRYIAVIGGCNDCHTANYAMMEGNVPESEWLKGDILGWRGPWGTTYPANLRLRLGEMSEDEWVAFARSFKTRPPMPWFALHAMTDEDLRSLYMFVTSFDDKGDPAPEFVPPDQVPAGPYIQFPAPPPQ